MLLASVAGRIVAGATGLTLILNVFMLPAVSVLGEGRACADVLTIFARGSGQDQDDLEDQLQTKKFFEELQNRAPTGLSIRAERLIYPATGGKNNYLEAEFSWAGDLGWGSYRASVETGINSVVSSVQESYRNCPDQKIILGGYSQGAQVMGDALYRLGNVFAERIAYVALFGDPKFKADSYAARGNFQRKGGGILEARENDFPEIFRGKVHSWCKQDDGICENQISKAFGPASSHPTYTEHEIPVAANEVAVRLQSLGFSTNSIPLGSDGRHTKLDVVLLVNSRGSMTDQILRIRANRDELLDHIYAAAPDVRVGLSEFRDLIPVSCGLEGARVLAALTNDVAFVKSKLSKLFGVCGLTIYDFAWYGIVHTIEQHPWRPDALKLIVVANDSIPFVQEERTDLTINDTIAAALNSGPIAVSTVNKSIFTNSESYLAFKQLAEATGGTITTADITGSYFDQRIMDRVDAFVNQPVAIGGRVQYGVPGQATKIFVSDSYDPDSSIQHFEWDFNSDGSYDLVTDSPKATHIFAGEYQGDVKVRIVSRDGGVTVIKVPLMVRNDNVIPTPSNQPNNLRIDYAREATDEHFAMLQNLAAAKTKIAAEDTYKVDLSWDAPLYTGHSVIDNYVILGNGNVLGVVSGSQTSATLRRVPIGAQIEVVAANEAGWGEPAHHQFEPTPDTEPKPSSAKNTGRSDGFKRPGYISHLPGVESSSNNARRNSFDNPIALNKDAVVLGEKTVAAIRKFDPKIPGLLVITIVYITYRLKRPRQNL